MNKQVYSKELKELFKNGKSERSKILKNIIKFSSDNPQIEHLEFTVIPEKDDKSRLQFEVKLFD
jgi:hypothetical protein